jgi:cytochrome c oxidase subunit 2
MQLRNGPLPELPIGRARRRLLVRVAAISGLAMVTGRVVVRAQAQPRIVPVVARRFVYEPDEITLKVNEPVVFQLTTLDVVMGFSVPDFAVRATIIPGKVTAVAMTPTKVGDFTFLCDVFCGSGHENMEGTLRVVA